MAAAATLALAVLAGRYDGEFHLDKFQKGARLLDPAMEHSLKLASQKEGCVIDVGANGGQQSHAALARGRETYAFECLASAYEFISKAAAAGVFPNVHKYTLIHGCAGSSVRFGKLHLAWDSSSMLSENVAQGYESRKANWSTTMYGRSFADIVVQPLDPLFPPEKKVALVKVDTQGNEYDVLQGMRQILSRDLPVVQYECMGCVRKKEYGWFKSSGEVRDLLQPLGYKCQPAPGREKLNQICHVSR